MQVGAHAELTPAVDCLLPLPASRKLGSAQALLSFEAGTASIASIASMDPTSIDSDPRTIRL